MKNVTVTLPDEVADWLRDRAAGNGRSVSLWLTERLEEMRRREDEYVRAMERYLARKPRTLRWADGRRPTREDLHRRTAPR